MEKMIILVMVLGLLVNGCAQVRVGTELASHYPHQYIRPGNILACQKHAVETVLNVEYSKWKTTFSMECYPDPNCKNAFHECMQGKGYRYVD